LAVSLVSAVAGLIKPT